MEILKKTNWAIYSKLSKGAIVVIDDYYDKSHKYIEEKLNNNIRNLGERKYNIKKIAPGVKKACDEFFKNKKEKPYILIAGDDCHAYFIKE